MQIAPPQGTTRPANIADVQSKYMLKFDLNWRIVVCMLKFLSFYL